MQATSPNLPTQAQHIRSLIMFRLELLMICILSATQQQGHHHCKQLLLLMPSSRPAMPHPPPLCPLCNLGMCHHMPGHWNEYHIMVHLTQCHQLPQCSKYSRERQGHTS